MTGSLAVSGGQALGRATRSCSGSCVAIGSAKAELAAGQAIGVTSVGNNLSVAAGTANALAGSGATSAHASAFAGAAMTAGTSVNIGVGNAVSLQAGLANASGSWAAAGTASARADADASLAAGSGIDISALGNLQILGGSANAVPTTGAGSGTATASARVDVSAGGLASLVSGGLLELASGTTSATAPGSSDTILADAAASLSAGTLDASAGGSVQLGGVLNNTGAAGGAAWSVRAGGNLTLATGIGDSASRFDDDLALRAGQTVAVDADIFLANRSLTMAADTDSTGGGDVDVRADAAEARRVDTQGSITISGFNFRVLGADPTPGGSDLARSASVNAAGNVNINLSGQAIIQGGTVTGTGSVSRDVSARLSAGNDISIDASGLSVIGGAATALASSADSSVASIDASATLNAGRDVLLTLTGTLGVAGGTAQATAYASFSAATATALANADATLTAVRNIVINSAGSLAVSGGSATATAGTGSASCLTCSAAATAKATLAALNITTGAPIGGNVGFTGGNASVSVNAAPSTGTVSFASAIVNADSRVQVSAAGTLAIDAGGSINALGGTAGAGGSLASVASVVMDASAAVQLSAGGAIALNAGGGSNNLAGGFASVGGSWSGATSVTGNAGAEASIAAGSSVTLTGTAELNVFGGIANANPGTGGGTAGAASAVAFATVSAPGSGVFSVSGGSMFVFDGSFSPGSSVAGPPTRRADANGRISVGAMTLNVSNDLQLISGGSMVAAGNMQISSGIDVNLTGGGNLVAAGGMSLTAGGSVNGSSAAIAANGLNMSAANNISLIATTTTLGSGAAPGVSGDSLLLDVMNNAGIGLPASSNPNARFEAGGGLISGDVNMTASDGYLWYSADQLSVGNISTPGGPLLVQYSPLTPSNSIGFEDLSSSLLQTNYDNSNHVSSLPMTTVAIGSAQQTGPITVGANGPIDIGARNIVFLTTPDDVNSTANIITTGIVATSGFVASVAREPEVFITPRLDSFRVETESWVEREQRRARRLLEIREGDHGMCTAL